MPEKQLLAHSMYMRAVQIVPDNSNIAELKAVNMANDMLSAQPLFYPCAPFAMPLIINASGWRIGELYQVLMLLCTAAGLSTPDRKASHTHLF